MYVKEGVFDVSVSVHTCFCNLPNTKLIEVSIELSSFDDVKLETVDVESEGKFTSRETNFNRNFPSESSKSLNLTFRFT